jgi:hypothetical protein
MDEKVIAVDKNQRHILFSRESSSLCGEIVDGDVRILDDFRNPVHMYDSVCDECMSEFREWISSEGECAPTVRCECDMISKSDGIETCNSVISAYRARELKNQGESYPVCESCYKWILSLESNGVSTPYSEAKPWFEERGEEIVT